MEKIKISAPLAKGRAIQDVMTEMRQKYPPSFVQWHALQGWATEKGDRIRANEFSVALEADVSYYGENGEIFYWCFIGAKRSDAMNVL